MSSITPLFHIPTNYKAFFVLCTLHLGIKEEKSLDCVFSVSLAYFSMSNKAVTFQVKTMRHYSYT